MLRRKSEPENKKFARLQPLRGTRRHWAISRKVAGSIPDGVIGIFHWHHSSCRTTAAGSIHSLTEMSTTDFSWGVKRPVPIVLKSGSHKLL